MPKALVIIDLPEKDGEKPLIYDAKTLIRHPQCADADGKLLKIVGIRSVDILTETEYHDKKNAILSVHKFGRWTDAFNCAGTI